jgi:hypothetical protein
VILIPNPSEQKKGEAGYDSFKKIKGINIGALTDKKV